MMKYSFLPLLGLLYLTACSPKISSPPAPITTFYQEQIKKWQAERLKELTSSNSWLSLAGLFWLKEGENSFGSSALNNIVFPEKTPNYIGKFIVENGLVTMNVAENVPVKIDTAIIKEVLLAADDTNKPTQMQLGSLNWHLIQRQDRLGIRLKDAKNPAIQEFGQLDYFPIDENWNVPAFFRRAEKGKQIILKNVLDMDIPTALVGYLEFEIAGVKYELEALEGGPDFYFLIFSDETTGVETYGAGRYVYAPRADETGKTLIDFNKSYNPPCAFTDFATCPLPSAKNRLDLAIRVGEKDYQHKPH